MNSLDCQASFIGVIDKEDDNSDNINSDMSCLPNYTQNSFPVNYNLYSPKQPTYTSTTSNSINCPWTLRAMGENDEFYLESYQASDEEDSYGPPVLSPQVDLLEDEQIIEYEFEEVELLWARPSEDIPSYDDNTLPAQPNISKPSRSNRRKFPDLASILRKPATRSNFTYAQYEALYATWEVKQFPHISEINELVHITGLNLSQVKNWFKNRRRLSKEHIIKGEHLRRKPSPVHRRVSDLSLSTSNSSSINSKLQSSVNDTDSSSSRSTKFATTPVKLNEKEKRQRRMNAIKHIPVSILEECMENNKARLSQLILMYMKKKLDMRRTLLRETTKLKDRTAAINPFSLSQVNAMKKWREDFFKEIGEELNEDKKQKLDYVKSTVIEVWQPVLTYGKLSKASLEIAIDDFSVLNESYTRSVVDTEEFTVPGILRYMESHFK